jgi:hypothetical protein
MYGDFSRLTVANARRRHYASVLLQQGRVHLDADWNELVALSAARTETTMIDVIGRTGAPKRDAGFGISRMGNSFNISAGRYYVDGVMVENDDIASYDGQAAGVVQPEMTDLLADGEFGIVYLDVWKEDVSALEDIRLREPALGGPDTTTRQKIAWHVGLEPISATGLTTNEVTSRAELGESIWLPGSGLLRAGTSVPTSLSDDSDCLLPPEAGYLSQDNLLYRVEIQRGGTRNQARFKWSRENGSVLALLGRNVDGEFILLGAREDAELGFPDDVKVEVFDDTDRHLGRAGVLRRMRRQGDATVTFTGGLGRAFEDMSNPRVRRWDQRTNSGNNGLSLNGASIALEKGIEIAFQPGDYRIGDYWLIPARAATGTIEWPPSGLPAAGLGGPLVGAENSPSFGWGRRRVPLAIVRRNGAGLSGQVTNLRPLFPSLTQLEAEDVRFDDSVCDMGADSVQQAINALCARSHGRGHCTFFASNVPELQAGLAAIGNSRNVHICLAEGDFVLDRPLVFSGLNHLRITGAGPETLVTASRLEAAIVIEGCRRVEVFDLRVRGQMASAADNAGRRGAITITSSDDVLIERVDAACSWAEWRGQSCLSIYGQRNTSSVVIRDCHLSVGQGQIGMQITNPRRAIIENNRIQAVAPSTGTIAARFARDTLLLRRIVAGAIALPAAASDRANIGRDTILRAIRQPLTVASRVGRAQAAIVVHPSVNRPIRSYLRARRSNLSIGNGTELYTHLRKTLARAIRKNGDFSAGGTRVRQFRPFINTLTGRTSPYCEEGIVIAGASIGEVQVRGNEINGAIHGIRVAASARNNPNPPNWMKTRPVNRVVQAIIEDNKIHNNPTAPTKPSNGIHVGHFESLIVRGKHIGFLSNTANADVAYWTGVRVYGWRGPLMRIVENVVEGARIGTSVRPNTEPQTGWHWDLDHNGYQNVTQPTDAGGSIDGVSHT